jgi:hypothetical protein
MAVIYINTFDTAGITEAKLVGINGRINFTKGIMRGDAIFQTKQFSEPLLFCKTKFFNSHPIISATNNRADADKENILQLMLLLSVNPGGGL